MVLLETQCLKTDLFHLPIRIVYASYYKMANIMNKQLNEITIEDVNMRSVTFKNLMELIERNKTDAHFNLWSDVSREIRDLLNLRQHYFLLHASESTRKKYNEGYSYRKERCLRKAKEIRREATDEFGGVETSQGMFNVLRNLISLEEIANRLIDTELAMKIHRDFVDLCNVESRAKKLEDKAEDEDLKVKSAILECWFKGKGIPYAYTGPAYVKSLLEHSGVRG